MSIKSAGEGCRAFQCFFNLICINRALHVSYQVANWCEWFSAGRGHYAAMDKTDTRAGYKARLVSPYINTTGKCLELFYWIRELESDSVETRLIVIAITEEHTEQELVSVTDLTPHFPRLYLRLPVGTHRVAIAGERSSERKFCALSLDDVIIMDCDKFGKMNTEIKC